MCGISVCEKTQPKPRFSLEGASATNLLAGSKANTSSTHIKSQSRPSSSMSNMRFMMRRLKKTSKRRSSSNTIDFFRPLSTTCREKSKQYWSRRSKKYIFLAHPFWGVCECVCVFFEHTSCFVSSYYPPGGKETKHILKQRG